MDFFSWKKVDPFEKLIISKLKSFSQIQKQYNINAIYRTTEHVSKIAIETCNTYGIPTRRTTTTNIMEVNPPKEGEYDILEPIWYATNKEDSMAYCRGNKNLNTYEYVPRDFSTIKNQKLLFLDLTSKMPVDEEEYGKLIDMYGITRRKYVLDKELIKPIYTHIIEKYSDYIIYDEDDKQNFMCVDNPCENTFKIPEIVSAYGYYDGHRISEHYIDKFFTIELFKLIKDLNLEEKYNFKFMGYFHSNVLASEINFDNKGDFEIDYSGWFPAEFAIPYISSCLTSYIDFKGMIGSCDPEKKNLENLNNNDTYNFNKRKLSVEEPISPDLKKVKKGGKTKKKRTNKNKKTKHRKKQLKK